MQMHLLLLRITKGKCCMPFFWPREDKAMKYPFRINREININDIMMLWLIKNSYKILFFDKCGTDIFIKNRNKYNVCEG